MAIMWHRFGSIAAPVAFVTTIMQLPFRKFVFCTCTLRLLLVPPAASYCADATTLYVLVNDGFHVTPIDPVPASVMLLIPAPTSKTPSVRRAPHAFTLYG